MCCKKLVIKLQDHFSILQQKLMLQPCSDCHGKSGATQQRMVTINPTATALAAVLTLGTAGCLVALMQQQLVCFY
jgi:hypothetical protein